MLRFKEKHAQDATAESVEWALELWRLAMWNAKRATLERAPGWRRYVAERLKYAAAIRRTLEASEA